MTRRRPLLLAGSSALFAWLAGPAAHAQQRRSLADPLRLGVDSALAASGLAAALQRAFGLDTGIAVQLVPGAAAPLLDALERGELDAALTNAPAAELKLDTQGLVHDRQAVAAGRFVIVGPAPRGKVRDPAGVAGGRDVAQALARIRDAALATPGAVTFLSAGDGSGTHLGELALWRAAKLAPAAPWYLNADPKTPLLAQARTRGAYAIAERGVWDAGGGAPLAVLVEGDPRLAVPVHAMRGFRVSHPAGKIFVAWLAGPKGRAVVTRQRGMPRRDRMSTMKLLSLNLGTAREVDINGRKVLTAIGKRAVAGPVAVRALGLVGDEQADLTVHGGVSKAVYAYPSEHYPFWQTVRAQAKVSLWDEALLPGSMGENLTMAGLLESQVCIGDVLRFPDCELAVSEPRFPCFKFNAAMGFTQALALMQANAWCGFYLAVRVPGTLVAGQAFELVHGPREVGVTELFRARVAALRG